MLSFKVFAVVALLAVVYAAEEAAKGEEETIKVYKRLIPADVLRGTIRSGHINLYEFIPKPRAP